MARTRVKICGITRAEDGIAAARAGADAIGLVFWPGTPRRVTLDQARAIVAALPVFVTVVGLFVMMFMGPPPHAFVPRAAIASVMLIVVFASTLPAAGDFSTALMAVNIGLGLVLLYWYVRE